MSASLSAFRAALVLAPILALAACNPSRDVHALQRSVSTLKVVDRAPQTIAVTPAVATAADRSPTVAAVSPGKVKHEGDEPKASSKPKSDGKRLQVNRLVLAKDVSRSTRQPQGVSTEFTKGEFEKIYAFLDVSNPADESEVFVSFESPSSKRSKGKIKLDVGTSPHWRTWASSKAVDEKGEWTAIVTAADGRELARQKFTVL